MSDKESAAPELLPCPRCGSYNLTAYTQGRASPDGIIENKRVLCECTLDAPLATWNERAEPSLLEAERERSRHMARAYLRLCQRLGVASGEDARDELEAMGILGEP